MKPRANRSATMRSRILRTVVALVLLAGLFIVSSGLPADANHSGKTLQVTREVVSRGTGETHSLEAILFTNNASGESTATEPIEIDWELSGAGDPDGTKSPETPDKTCTIDDGESRCSITFTSSIAGLTLVRAWIDHDKRNESAGGVTEADREEGRYAGNHRLGTVGNDCLPDDGPSCPEATEVPGSKSEPDDTDVVQVTWTGTASRLDCDPESETNPHTGAGSSETYLCKATDAFGGGVSDVFIDGEQEGANDPNDDAFNESANTAADYNARSTTTGTAGCVTNDSGECTWTVSSEGETGTALICFWIDLDEDGGFNLQGDPQDGGDCEETVGEAENNDITDKVQKTWSTDATVTVDHLHLWAAGSESADCHTGLNTGNDYVPAGKNVVVCAHTSGHQPINALSVTFNESGPAVPNSQAKTTDDKGKATFGISSQSPGISTVTSSSSGRTSNSFTMTWQGGYWLVASDGGIFAFGDAEFFGSTGNIRLNQPIVGMAATPSGNGYWMVATDGGIFAFGDAGFFGSTGAIKLNQPIVGMSPTPDGRGYWLVASDGGIFAFGSAKFFGSTGAIRLNQPIVGMTSTPSGNGYWLVATDGGIFAFGDAAFYGSTGATKLNQPIVGMERSQSGRGYWLVASDGGIFAFGDASFRGSTGNIKLTQPIVGMRRTWRGGGYWMVATDGGIFAFGDAPFFGSTGATKLNQPIVGMDKAN